MINAAEARCEDNHGSQGGNADQRANDGHDDSAAASETPCPHVHEVLTYVREELLQVILAVALVLDVELEHRPDVSRSQVEWAASTLREGAREAKIALHLNDLPRHPQSRS